MSYSLDETTYNSPNFTSAADCPAVFGHARTIEGIVVHWWDDPALHPKFEVMANWLCNGNRANPTSAHFVLEEGRVACLVSPEDAAWHSGNAIGNATTIGIECNPRMSEGDIQTLVEFIAWIESVYGPMKVYGHKDWFATGCPGTYYDRLPEIIDRVNKLENGGAAPKAPKPSAPANNLSFSHVVESAIGWMAQRQGQVTYSMFDRNGPYSYDCSSAVSYALAHAGVNPGVIGNTETMFHDLPKWGFEKVHEGAGLFNMRRGDIFIWGRPGQSDGVGCSAHM